MLTELQRQFVEVAARTMFEHRAASAPVPAHWSGREETWRRMEQCVGVQPLDREHASYLLGRLEGVNDATIEEIVSATRDLVESDFETSDCPGHWHCDPAAVAHVCHMDRDNTACRMCGARRLDPDTLFRAIAHEALGQGSVRETFGEIRLCPRHVPADVCSAAHPLVIPSLTVERSRQCVTQAIPAAPCRAPA